jgi:uncharacterized protein (TIGR02466 family)
MEKNTVNAWFPTLVYRNKLERFYEMNSSFIRRSYEIEKEYPDCKSNWYCNSYNTQNVYNLLDDLLFSSLIKQCEKEVKDFSFNFGVASSIKCTEAWLNIAKPNQHQEYHIHPNRHFSLVYYVKTPADSGNIRFKSPIADSDMFVLPIKKHTNASYATCYYTPEEGTVLAFRSNLQHMVEVNKSNEDRISIAMNFICE